MIHLVFRARSFLSLSLSLSLNLAWPSLIHSLLLLNFCFILLLFLSCFGFFKSTFTIQTEPLFKCLPFFSLFGYFFLATFFVYSTLFLNLLTYLYFFGLLWSFGQALFLYCVRKKHIIDRIMSIWSAKDIIILSTFITFVDPFGDTFTSNHDKVISYFVYLF